MEDLLFANPNHGPPSDEDEGEEAERHSDSEVDDEETTKKSFN